MTNLQGRKRILCLDFDGVCHSYISGWQGADVINDPPVPGLFEFLREAARVFEIDIFSSRTHQDGGLEAMKRWFDEHQEGIIEELDLQFPAEKPPSFVGIDDRVVTFTGEWPSVDSLDRFTPWNKKVTA